MTCIINYVWARILFTMIFIPVHIKYEMRFKRKEQFIFCANHFSYLDIPMMGHTFNDFAFVGKSSIAKIPLFGYMFRKLHITVDRSSFRDRHSALLRSVKAIEEGKSLLIFPEGGIVTTSPPQLARFKDGAFRTAIEKQIPIIPVTIPHNWILLPDETFILNRKPASIIYHKPIDTRGMTLNDLDKLRNQTFEIIQATLNELNRED